ncbi:EAL domain-containing protein [Candidatus Phycosocius spiralis]|uniref:Diguanylate phosphodiesterase n=1 Tax=Candidatus Phycosocius spiralis TaxID=2815099 RepID=A0ABQ4PVY5_9PROT|nr:EAL domain-containing protein [Candidatus Phycosocius spiralis]GIU67163.1 diguanylate phosphodiesterase [Candidatus Phycosocius spiralis]
MQALVHIFIFLIYAIAGIGLGAYSHFVAEVSTAVSVCMGGLLCVASGLFHLAFAPRRSNLSKEERLGLDRELQAIKDSQTATHQEIEALKTHVVEDATTREAKFTREVQQLATLLNHYIQGGEKRSNPSGQDNPATAPQRSDQSLLSAIRSALEENRVELHLQPIVALPQRKIVYYEGFTRLRDPSGAVILPSEFMRVAEPSGLVGEIDNMLLLRCVQIARRLIKHDRRMAIFCNISTTSLADETFFPQFMTFLRDNRDLAGSIIFELSRHSFEKIAMVAERNMGRLFDLGFRFSLDRCDTIDLDLRKLERMGVRYVKISGEKLVQQLVETKTLPVTGLNREFDPADVSAVFSRYGVELIADRVESERTIVEILELDITHAQGNLFGRPRSSTDVLNAANEAPRLRMVS